MSARKPDPANGLGAAVGTDDPDVLELGVTVTRGPPPARRGEGARAGGVERHVTEDSRAIPHEQLSMRGESHAWHCAPLFTSRAWRRHTPARLLRSSTVSRLPTSICAASCGSVSTRVTGGALSKMTSSRRWCWDG